MTSGCVDCKYFVSDYDESDGHIVGAWVDCELRPSMAGLKSFPFKNTKCSGFTHPKRVTGKDT